MINKEDNILISEWRLNFDGVPICVIDKRGNTEYDMITKECGRVLEGYRWNDAKEQVLEKIKFLDIDAEDYNKSADSVCKGNQYISNDIVLMNNYSISKFKGKGFLLYAGSSDEYWREYRLENNSETGDPEEVIALLKGDESNNELITLNRARLYVGEGKSDIIMYAAETPEIPLSFEEPYMYIFANCNTSEILDVITGDDIETGIFLQLDQNNEGTIGTTKIRNDYYIVKNEIDAYNELSLSYYNIDESTLKETIEPTFKAAYEFIEKDSERYSPFVTLSINNKKLTLGVQVLDNNNSKINTVYDKEIEFDYNYCYRA